MNRLLLNILVFTMAFSNAAKGLVLDINGAITPPVLEYLDDGIAEANQGKYDFLLIQMDTPGGLYETTRQIGQSILSSPVPIITYVSPQGARAASAGTFILYASHIAAMAPGTHVGAATPVSIAPQQSGESQPDDAMKNKIMNDTKAYIRSLAQYRNRNIEFGIAAVTDAASITAEEALQYNVVDAIAPTANALLNQVHERKVLLQNKMTALNTLDASLVKQPLSLKQRILMTITDPNITYLLLMAGIYGLLIELFNPGSIVPGVIGAVCLLIASYSLHILPINYAGLGLIILGIAFLVAEAFIPSFGIIGFAGVIALIIGSFFLFDRVSWAEPSIWVMMLVVSALSLGALMLIRINIRAHRSQPVSGIEGLIGKNGRIIEKDENGYAIRVEGQIWDAISDTPLEIGQIVIIDRILGLTAHVIPKEDNNV